MIVNSIIRGRVWKFGDSVSTDIISPGAYYALPIEEKKRHAMEPMRPEFASSVKPGDVIVAGIDFGCGSSRESAPAALKALGVSAIVAESFARNSIAIGLPVITCPQVSSGFVDGDKLELDLTNFKVTNVNKEKTFQALPLPSEMLNVLIKGGIMLMLKEIGSQGQ
jgi:3-isopropylmalate/(R)-2-methylmalate dehydratase small subunit